ncbi:hypothetical protein E2C01_085312 [Portunus trituberculatus]|uniref:Uncharacterized protein n=1 Tax=Portunus trituberculatus TaxID=210409 RepID=A0A5B7J797_PORTR|nr:hypothetical protein [Portunus trituberculatus]
MHRDQAHHRPSKHSNWLSQVVIHCYASSLRHGTFGDAARTTNNSSINDERNPAKGNKDVVEKKKDPLTSRSLNKLNR